MRANKRIYGTALVAAMLLSAGCKPPPPPPPPPPVKKPEIQTGSDVPTVSGPKLVQGPVRIDMFTVEPTAIERGQSATLRWSVANATDITIDQGLGTVQGTGSRQIFPTTTTTYTLTARSTAGTDSRLVTVEVRLPPAPPEPPKPRDTTTTDTRRMWDEGMRLDILFDYDMAEVRPDGREALDINVRVLRQIFAVDPAYNVTIEGHADERGTAEYNLGLADRRATAVRDYLLQAGIPANRLRTISFGEERPACTDQTEACYQRNRRAHFERAQ